MSDFPAKRDKHPMLAAEAKPWHSGTEAPFVRLSGITKRFGQVVAVDNLSQEIYRGELFAILGGSGSGKSTLLRMIAGLEQPDTGSIEIDGNDVTDMPAHRRPVNMMFQSYALFPHMTVTGNIGYGLRREGLPREEIEHRVSELVALLHLEGLGGRKPHQLSGGQRQRVALARALAKRPKLLLLDEPLGALDKKLRERTQFELVRIQEQLGLTFVVVTHDQEEAMTLATRIAVMDAGSTVQVGEPTQIYNAPRSQFVADFIGSTNLFDVEVVGTGEGAAGAGAGTGAGAAGTAGAAGAGAGAQHEYTLSLEGVEVTARSEVALAQGDKLKLSLRPEVMRLAREPSGHRNAMPALIEDIAFLGSHSVYLLRLTSGREVTLSLPNRSRTDAGKFSWDEAVYICWAEDDGVLLSG